MFGFLKFWKWFGKREIKLKDPKPKKVKLYPARNVVLLTSESNAELVPCQVMDDHRIKFGKKNVMIKPETPAVTLTLPMYKLWPTFLGRKLGPKFQRFNLYICRDKGEMTHEIYSIHRDGLKDDERQKVENMLKLIGKFAEAEAGGALYDGIKGPKKWFDYIPYLVILGIVFFFLFAFQIQPNM